MKSQINFNKVNKHNSKYTVKNTIYTKLTLFSQLIFLQISCFMNFKFWAKYDDLL